MCTAVAPVSSSQWNTPMTASYIRGCFLHFYQRQLPLLVLYHHWLGYMDYTGVRELKAGVRGARIRCRVARTWDCTNPMFENRLISVDVLFVDQSGDAIQGTVRPVDAQWLRDSIQEGNVYLCSGFIVITATNDYRACKNPDMLFLARRTTTFQMCSEQTSCTIPLHSFDLTNYNDLSDRTYKTRYLSDVIGHLISMGSIEETYIKEKPVDTRTLELQDTEGNTISATLWSAVAYQIDDAHVKELLQQGPVVVILASVYVTRLGGGKLALSSKSGTRVYINVEHSATTSFRQSLTNPSNFTIKAPTPTKEQLMVANRKSVSELLHLSPTTDQAARFTCSVTIKDVNPFNGWWFSACPSCHTKVAIANTVYWCDNCYTYIDDIPVHWYRLEMVVEDDEADCVLIVIGRHAERLIGQTAFELASKNTDKFVLPNAIKKLKGTSRIFEVQLMRRNSTAAGSQMDHATFKVTRTFEELCALNEPTSKRAKTKDTSSGSTNEGVTSS